MKTIEKHYKRYLITLKRKHVVLIIILIIIIIIIIIIIVIITLTKRKQWPFLGYQQSDQKSKKKYNSLDLE